MKTVLLFSQKEIDEQVKELAAQINNCFGTNDLLAIGILKGAFVFYTNLLRQLKANVICDFCSVSFYGDKLEAGEEPSFTLDIQTAVKGKNILLVDCISDHGYSLNFIRRRLEERKPKSIKTVALIVKPLALKSTVIDFKGFEVDQDVFVVGYGIDYKNQGRHLNHFAQVSNIN